MSGGWGYEPGYGSGYESGPQRGLSEAKRRWIVFAVTIACFAGWLAIFAPDTVRNLLGLRENFETSADFNGPGEYAFLAHQDGDPSEPVTYSSCKTISVTMNPAGAPDNAEELVLTAIDHITSTTGLNMAYGGTSKLRPGNHPNNAPVLVSWADAKEVPGLKGNIAGLGGSVSLGNELGRRYVTGEVTLDTDTFSRLEGEFGGDSEMQAIVDHEFGHLVGLDHVKDRDQLMFSDNIGTKHFQNGDLKGLALLGRGPC